jgi:hypothetical protein
MSDDIASIPPVLWPSRMPEEGGFAVHLYPWHLCFIVGTAVGRDSYSGFPGSVPLDVRWSKLICPAQFSFPGDAVSPGFRYDLPLRVEISIPRQWHVRCAVGLSCPHAQCPNPSLHPMPIRSPIGSMPLMRWCFVACARGKRSSPLLPHPNGMRSPPAHIPPVLVLANAIYR